jgi:trans-aconitate 2-methyltransferase
MNIYKWDAKDYQDNSAVQQKWARELIAKIGLKGREAVLDIGCGDGKITAEISKELPDGSIIGVDNSMEMIDLASKNFPCESYKNISFKLCDAKELFFCNEFDMVFSNATLHWVKNHTPVLQGIKKALKKNGKLLIQMGGKGNAREIIEVVDSIKSKLEWEEYFMDFEFPYSFFGSDEYKILLYNAGFKINYIKLINKDMTHNGKEGLKGWFRTTWFPYTNRIPENLRDLFIDEVINNYIKKYPLDNNGYTHVKMVRLEIMAEKS